MNFNKLLLVLMLCASTLISISSGNYIGIWMGMEMNLMAFIPMISESKNMKSSKAIMIYFLVQSISSILLLFFLMMNLLITISPNLINSIIKNSIMISLSIKLGLAPFHNWLPLMMSNMKWMEVTILMTWQKIAPIYMMNAITPNKTLILMIVLSSFFGAIGGLNYSNIMKILAYSSINHMSWIMMMLLCQSQWLNYLLIYSMIIIMMSSFMYNYNMYYINQIPMKYNSIPEKLMFSSILLSMGGMPPFLGFLPKWMVIQSMIYNKYLLLMLFLIMMSMITLFYYIRIISTLILFYSSMNKFIYTMKSIKFIYVMMMINLSLPMFLIYSF